MKRPSPRTDSRPGAVASRSPDTDTRNEGESAARCEPGDGEAREVHVRRLEVQPRGAPAPRRARGTLPLATTLPPRTRALASSTNASRPWKSPLHLHLADAHAAEAAATVHDAEGALSVGGGERAAHARLERGEPGGAGFRCDRLQRGEGEVALHGEVEGAVLREGDAAVDGERAADRRRRDLASGRPRLVPARGVRDASGRLRQAQAGDGRLLAVPSIRNGSVLHSSRRTRPLAARPSPA